MLEYLKNWRVFGIDSIPIANPKENTANINGRTIVYKKDPKGLFKAWEQRVEYEVGLRMREKDWKMFKQGVPLAMGQSFWIPRPKSVKPSVRPFPTVRPDYDNFKYAITNIFRKLVYYDDDQIVMSLPGVELYADIDEPGAEIIVAEIDVHDPAKIHFELKRFYKGVKI